MDNREFLAERQARLEKVLNRWAVYTEGIADVNMRSMVSQLLENQAQPTTSLFEADINTGNLPTAVFPSKIAFPTIVQAFPLLAANELVQVTAMDAPRALALYKNFIRSSNGSKLTHDGSWTATAESGTPAKARMRLDTIDLAVSKYMLNMEWTAELEEDARALGNIDVQAELIAAMRDEVAGQLDGMVIDDLFAAAAASDVTGPNGMVTARAGAGNVNFSKGTFASYETPKAHEQMILNAFVDLKTQIFSACLRIPNFIVGDAASVGYLEKLGSFAPGDTAPAIRGSDSTVRVGRLAGQYDVYLSTQAPANKFLMGVKGSGYIYGVYKPFELTPPTYNNNTDEWIRGIRTRVARKTVDAAYYGTLTLTA
jgi:hypothetical protein